MAKRIAYLGMFTALAMVLGWLESLVPIVLVVPGMKLGLANVVTVVILYRFGWKEAGVVNLLRVGLSAVLFGNLSLFLYSLAGAALSLAGMALLKKSDKFSVPVVSVVGGIAHNIGQFIMAILLIENRSLLYYLPFLMLSGLISGVLIGLCGAWLHRHLPAEIS